ncbi:MAG TPA: S41 family peptidase, partial [Puia sp.]|nr:S41 family peptidase [Puia sp.]
FRTILIICVFSTGLSAQPVDCFQKIAPDALRSDFLLLRDSLQQRHPSLYRFNSKATIDHIFDSCQAATRDSMTVGEFYLLTSFVIASIGDGHANCRLSGQMMNNFVSNVKVFPAMVLFIHERAYVYCCKQNDALAGTELLSINGRSMNEIIRRLYRYIPTDGNIQSRRNWEMPEFFHFLYAMVYGVRGSYVVTCKTRDGEVRTATLQADYLHDFICASPFPRPSRYLQLSYTSDNIAILTIRTFFDGFLQQTGESFISFLDSAFNDIKAKKVKKLIIDGRRNQGGNDRNGDILYSYLTQKPFMYYATREMVSGKVPESQDHELSLHLPRANSYSGKVYFLMDGRSFSATAEFSAIARSNKRGPFVGEETGGTYCGNTSGGEITLRLPNTQINCRIPLVRYTMAVKENTYMDRGVMPDYDIYPTVSDLIGHKDGEMDYTLRLVEKD